MSNSTATAPKITHKGLERLTSEWAEQGKRAGFKAEVKVHTSGQAAITTLSKGSVKIVCDLKVDAKSTRVNSTITVTGVETVTGVWGAWRYLVSEAKGVDVTKSAKPAPKPAEAKTA